MGTGASVHDSLPDTSGRGGHGLENMRRRASALGGTARIDVARPGSRHQHRRGRAGDRTRMFMRLATSDRDANMSPVNGARGERSSPAPLRVAIVEDDVTTREGLAALIDGTPGYRCVGRYGAVEELLRKPPDRPADVLLLDINLPGISGAEGVRLVRERWSSTDVLMLTVYSDENKIFESICNGAVGYLLKKTPPARLLDAIREAASGGAPMSPEIARKVVTLFRKTPGRRTAVRSAHPAGVAPAAAAGGWPQLSGRSRTPRDQPEYRAELYPERVRQAARPLEIRSRQQGAPQRSDRLTKTRLACHLAFPSPHVHVCRWLPSPATVRVVEEITGLTGTPGDLDERCSVERESFVSVDPYLRRLAQRLSNSIGKEVEAAQIGDDPPFFFVARELLVGSAEHDVLARCAAEGGELFRPRPIPPQPPELARTRQPRAVDFPRPVTVRISPRRSIQTDAEAVVRRARHQRGDPEQLRVKVSTAEAITLAGLALELETGDHDVSLNYVGEPAALKLKSVIEDPGHPLKPDATQWPWIGAPTRIVEAWQLFESYRSNRAVQQDVWIAIFDNGFWLDQTGVPFAADLANCSPVANLIDNSKPLGGMGDPKAPWHGSWVEAVPSVSSGTSLRRPGVADSLRAAPCSGQVTAGKKRSMVWSSSLSGVSISST